MFASSSDQPNLCVDRTSVPAPVSQRVSVINALINENANNEEYVKNLLFSSKKEDGIRNLQRMASYIHRKEMKYVYLKILPVYFSHSEVFGVMTQGCICIIDALLNNPIFDKEKRLFKVWQNRLNREIMNLRMNHLRGKSNFNYHAEENCEFSLDEFVVIGENSINPIGYIEIDYFNAFHRWLKHHKLHKYLFFFANLSYEEIENLTESNIRTFEEKVGIMKMTTGARNAILRKLDELKTRGENLREIAKANYYDDDESVDEIQVALNSISDIMRTPIRGVTICKEELADLLVDAFANVTQFTLKLKSTDSFLKVQEKLEGMLKRAWPKYYFDENHKSEINFLNNDLSVKKMKKVAVINVPIKCRTRNESNTDSGIGLSESTNSDEFVFIKAESPQEKGENLNRNFLKNGVCVKKMKSFSAANMHRGCRRRNESSSDSSIGPSESVNNEEFVLIKTESPQEEGEDLDRKIIEEYLRFFD